MGRPLATATLLTLFASALAVGALALYADRVLFDSSRFADRAQDALAEPAVREQAGIAVSDALVRAEPDLIAVEPLIRSVAADIAGSRAFRALFRGAVYQTHASVFSSGDDTFALTLANAALLVGDALEAQGIELPRKAERARARVVAVSGGPAGRALTDLAQAAERARPLALVAFAVALAALLVAAVTSDDRRLLARRAGLATAAVGGLLVAALVVARSAVVAQTGEDGRDAVAAVWDAFLADLRRWGVALAAAGLVVAAVADSLLRPAGIGERLRGLARAIAARPRRPAVRALRALALAAAGIWAIVSPAAVLELATLAAGVLLLALGAEELLHLTAASPRARARRRAPLWRPAAAGLVTIVVLAGLASLLIATDQTGDAAEPVTDACNGSAALCDRRLDAVAFAATHNAMSEPRAGFLLPNQEAGIRSQLEAGVRALLIDTHLGVRTDRGVYTLLEEGGKSREKIEQAIGPEATRRAEALRAQIGFAGGGEAEVYLCHGFCELGARPAEDALAEVRDFLVTHPGEVLVLSIEDQVSPEQTAEVFEESGLLDLVWQGPVRPLPTLGEMADRNQRVLVMGEEATGTVRWYHPQFELVQDTPYDVRSARDLLSRRSCARNRGEADSPLLMLNHWVAGEPPRPRDARRVNDADTLVARARRCARALGAFPSLLAVDFYREGDVVEAARRLNASAPQDQPGGR